MSHGLQKHAPPVTPVAGKRLSTVLPSVSRKPRRWLYFVLPLAGLVCWALGGLIVLGAYGVYLYKTYTSASSQPLPSFEATSGAHDEMIVKFMAFKKAVEDRKAVPPLEISAGDLNALLSRNPRDSKFLRFQIETNRLKAVFSAPLDRKKPKARFLNGVVTLALKYDVAELSLRVDKVEANGKPAPGWIVSKAREKNFLERVDTGREFNEFLSNLREVTITNNLITLVPDVMP
jgi:hypothetical protein